MNAKPEPSDYLQFCWAWPSDLPAHGSVSSELKQITCSLAQISARVLQCDPVAKKIVLTLKKQLLKIDSPIITSLEDAEVGKKAYGMVTGLKDYGIFVSFFGSTSGLVRTADLGLKEDEKLSVRRATVTVMPGYYGISFCSSLFIKP